jgi:ssDNA-binding Zn-finger/Zn-ribbon topoisomerase 1
MQANTRGDEEMNATVTKKAPKDWKCQECGKRMTLKAAERAMLGPNGCPKCGGSDIDMAPPPPYGTSRTLTVQIDSPRMGLSFEAKRAAANGAEVIERDAEIALVKAGGKVVAS